MKYRERVDDRNGAPVVGDGPRAVARAIPTRVARRQGRPLAVVCAVVGILGTSAWAPGLSRSESGLASATEPVRLEQQVFRDCEVCPEMVVVPAGSYMMGSPASEEGRDDDEGPRHRVTIGYSFAVGVYEVTFAEWDACLAAGGCGGYRPAGAFEGPGGGPGPEIDSDPRNPVIRVSWDDARRYVDWLSAETGAVYRLLSEAEWEYVARAGTETAWYWRGSKSEQCRYENGGNEWYYMGLPTDEIPEDACFDGSVDTAPVGSFAPNPWGLYDMLGNVSEWTEDCWNEIYSGAPADGSAWRSENCFSRVLRGGSSGSGRWDIRSANRDWSPADFRRGSGFRVARTIADSIAEVQQLAAPEQEGARQVSDSIARTDADANALAEMTRILMEHLEGPSLHAERIAYVWILPRGDGVIESLGNVDVIGHLHELPVSPDTHHVRFSTLPSGVHHRVSGDLVELNWEHLRDTALIQVQRADDNVDGLNFRFALSGGQSYFLIAEGHNNNGSGPYTLWATADSIVYRYTMSDGRGGMTAWSDWATLPRVAK